MNLEATLELARKGELYPAVILHGASFDHRLEAAVELARTLLCEAPAPSRPCGGCRHCRRIAWPSKQHRFHPDFHVLERDLKTSTSVEATKSFLRPAYVSPFEARGQVFVLVHAETLTGQSANALLKVLEEPPSTTPRHFFLLAPASMSLLPTLRSRSLALYLGPGSALATDEVEQVASDFQARLESYLESDSAVYLLAAARTLLKPGGWEDPRNTRPWRLGAAALVQVAQSRGLAREMRRRLLALAEDLLDGPQARLRGVPAQRIVEGLIARHLA